MKPALEGALPYRMTQRQPQPTLGRNGYLAPRGSLPDIVGADPVIVFCGMAGADSHKTRDHYYASPGNNFGSACTSAGSPRAASVPRSQSMSRRTSAV